MKQAKATVTPDVLANIRKLVIHVVAFHTHNVTAVRAVRATQDLPLSEFLAEAVREAVTSHQDHMETNLCLCIEELCDGVGINYFAAKEGDCVLTAEEQAEEVVS